MILILINFICYLENQHQFLVRVFNLTTPYFLFLKVVMNYANTGR